MEALLNGFSESVPQSDSEYIGEDGLLHCSICHQKTERIACIPSLGINRKVRCICDCKRKENEAHDERKRQEEFDRQRRICFAETNMANWNFQNDDRRNARLSDAMKNYANNFMEFRKDGQGLLLYGTVGTGKTYYAACIANALIDTGFTVKMTNFMQILNRLQDLKENKQQFIDGLNRYSLLIIDDLGAERSTEFAQEQVFNVIDARYRSGLPFIITTNLTAEELKKPQDVGYSRIYDRILERCHPVAVTGASRRRQNVKEGFAEMQAKLGLN